MATFVDFPARPATRGKQGPISSLDRRASLPFRRLMSAVVSHLGVAHPGRFERERPSLFEAFSPERR